MLATSAEIFAPAKACLDFDERLSRQWFSFEVDCADAQRELNVFRSEVERGGGEVPVRFEIAHSDTRTGNAPAVLWQYSGNKGRLGVCR